MPDKVVTLDLEKMAREFVAREIEVNANAIDVEDVIQLMMLFAHSVQKASEEHDNRTETLDCGCTIKHGHSSIKTICENCTPKFYAEEEG